MRWKRALTLGASLAVLSPTAAMAASTELSTSNRLQDRREVAAGTRAYSIGFEDGRFYANGWHITGEMGGVWAPPIKLLDGVWFGVDDQWAGQATKFTSGRGYVRYDLPSVSGLQLRRTDFVPDGTRGALYGLELANPGGAARTVTVKVDARSELTSAYPWAWTTPNASDNDPDTASYADGTLTFRDTGSTGGEPHDYTALVAADAKVVSGAAGDGYWGPQTGKRCESTDSTSPPSACDDGPFGNGKGGELRYRVTVPARGASTLWVAVAGSDQGLGAARRELGDALRNPDKALAAKIQSRAALARWSRVSLPGDQRLADAVEWGKQNLADLTQSAENLRIRWTKEGAQYPPPIGTVRRVTFFGAGYPDYPWLFATDGEYTGFAAVALGQFETIEQHLLALRDVSDLLNQRSGKVAHEIVTDGSVYYGENSSAGNTDETVKFPSALALVWRWTGDDRFRDELYDFAVRNMRYVVNNLDADHDGWPEGLGNVERAGMGEEKLDNTVYFVRGLYDLADLARSKHDRATERWASGLARQGQQRFDSAGWHIPSQQYADSLDDPGDVQVQQKHWIGVTPMEAELTVGGRAVPGLAPYQHGVTALAQRETDCYSGTPPYNPGLFHTGCGGGPTGAGERTIFGLNTAIQAVGEGNYGRTGPGQQQRYTGAEAEPMFAEPATGGTPDEQPGALPEILPSPDFGDRADNDWNINRCWSCRAMFVQAWGHYGTAWPVIHQQLGVRPSLGDGLLEVVPQVPDGQPRVQGDDIRLGDGTASVLAARDRNRYVTAVMVDRVKLHTLLVGATLPHGARVADVRLDGHRVKAAVRETNRGVEVTASAHGHGRHVLTVTAA